MVKCHAGLQALVSGPLATTCCWKNWVEKPYIALVMLSYCCGRSLNESDGFFWKLCPATLQAVVKLRKVQLKQVKNFKAKSMPFETPCLFLVCVALFKV